MSDHRGNIFNINRLSYNLFFVIQYDLDTERQEKTRLCALRFTDKTFSILSTGLAELRNLRSSPLQHKALNHINISPQRIVLRKTMSNIMCSATKL